MATKSFADNKEHSIGSAHAHGIEEEQNGVRERFR
jgi:hypothetical protein